MPPDEQSAIEAAEGRARAMARIDSHLDQHDRQLAGITDSVGRSASELRAVRESVADLRNEFRQSLAIAADRAQTAKEIAQKQVTSRELYLTAVGVTTAIISALAAGGVFH